MKTDLLTRARLERAGSLLVDAAKDLPSDQPLPVGSSDFLDLSPRDLERYSLAEGINAFCDVTMHQASSVQLGGIVGEAHRELAKRRKEPPAASRLLVPRDILMKRDLTVASGSGGGYLVGTSNGSFIDLRRAVSVLFRLGAQFISGLQDSVAFPRAASGTTAAWLSSESTQSSATDAVFEQVLTGPKNCAASTNISRQLLLQGQAADQIVKGILARDQASAIDAAGLNGSGSNGQPRGILNTSGIGVFVSGASVSYGAVLNAERDVADANGAVNPDALGFVAHPDVAEMMKTRTRFTSTDQRLWSESMHFGLVEGVPAIATRNMPSLSALYGDFSQVTVLEWGGLEIDVNPFQNFQAGIVGVRCFMSADIAVFAPGSFSKGTSIS